LVTFYFYHFPLFC